MKYIGILLRAIIIGVLISLIAIQMGYNQISNKTLTTKETLIEATPKRSIIMTLLIDSSFTPEEDFLIEQAANEWQVATNGIARFYVVYNNDPYFNVEQSNRDTLLKVEKIIPIKETESITFFIDLILNNDTLGYSDETNMLKKSANTIMIVRGRIISNEEYKTVVMHEIGHSLFMIHSNFANTLMYPSAKYAADCITKKDLEQFCFLYGCNVDDLNYCISKKVTEASLDEQIFQQN
jgi:hypothetical protein